MKYYFKLDANNTILDAITYPIEGYIEVQLPDSQLPAGINAGYYKWDGTNYQMDQAARDALDVTNLNKRMTENADIVQKAQDDYTLQLIAGGIL